MYHDVLADRVRYFKETEGGQTQMSKAVEDLMQEVAQESAVLASIETSREYNVPESEILSRIMNKYELSQTEAEEYMAKGNKNE